MKRKCPRTNTSLREIDLGGITVDFSDACGGVFFDNFELQKFDDRTEFLGEYLCEIMANAQNSNINFSERLKCPNCPDIVMMRRGHSPKKLVEIDECPACAGLWFDAGELATIRQHFPHEQARRKATEELIEQVMNSPEVIAHEKELQRDIENAEQMSRRLRRIIGFW